MQRRLLPEFQRRLREAAGARAKPKTATRQEPAARRAAPAAPRGGGKCFSFNGKTYCE